MKPSTAQIAPSVLVVLLVLLTGLHSHAKDVNLALGRFEPTPAGDSFFGVDENPELRNFGIHARMTFDWAHNPLVLHDAANNNTVNAIVANQLLGNLGVAMVVAKRFSLSLDLPIALMQSGPRNQPNGIGVPTPSGIHMADVRLGARTELYTSADHEFRLGAGLYLMGPFGSSSSGSGAYASDGSVRGRVELLASGERNRIAWAVSFGPDIRKTQKFLAVRQGTMLRTGAAIGMRFFDDRSLQVGPEVSNYLTLGGTTRYNTNLEALVGARYRSQMGFELGLAAGPGLTSGIGTPDVRVVGTIAYALGTTPVRAEVLPPAPPPEPVALHEEPAIALVPLPPPTDRDLDGIFDDTDACADVPGLKTDDAATNGCPAPGDRDGDTIIDEVDACPDNTGVSNPDPAKNGCPAAQVIGDQIVVLDQIQFETNSDVIKAESEVTLQGILASIHKVPEDRHFRVEGHTDNRGGAAHNKELSLARANAVVKWLVDQGIDGTRFETEGFGPDRPIASNKKESGRKFNRRVEIHIIHQDSN